MDEERNAEAVDAAARLLKQGDRSRAELEQRLAAKGLPPDARAHALETLERVGALDDGRTAELRAARLAERGYGDAYIRAELEQRGLPVEDALAALEPEAARAAQRARHGAAWLARRGFSEDSVEAALAR